MRPAGRAGVLAAAAWAALVVLDAASPLLAKQAATAGHWTDGLVSGAFLGALGCDLVAAWVWTRILATTPLATAVPASGVAYALVAVLASALYGEHVPPTGWCALALIAIGMALIAAPVSPAPVPPLRQTGERLLS